MKYNLCPHARKQNKTKPGYNERGERYLLLYNKNALIVMTLPIQGM